MLRRIVSLGAIFVVTYALVTAVSIAVIAWTGPTDAPPNANVSAPLNIGSVSQVKSGGLGVTNMIADQFCLGIDCIASWADAASGWAESSGDVYFTGGNVGIGNNNPNYTLDVTGDINFTGDIYQDGVPFSGGGAVADLQTFTSSGTWTKPTGFDADSHVVIHMWGGGGAASGDYGGGGGGYIRFETTLANLSGTESVVIGAGGPPGGNVTSRTGGMTYFGTLGVNGGRGGAATAGSGGSSFSDDFYGGGHGARGASNSSSSGGKAYWGGGGGASDDADPGEGGGDSLHGGDGGGRGQSGFAPGGGGGGPSGAGARGEVQVFVYPFPGTPRPLPVTVIPI